MAYKTIEDVKLNIGREHRIIQAKVNWSPKFEDDLIQGCALVDLGHEYVAWTIVSRDNGETFDACWGSYSISKNERAFEETYEDYKNKIGRICP